MKSFRLYLVLLGFFFLVSCSLKPRGWWKEGSIAVMADSTDWEALQGVLRGVFERVVRTPQLEKLFSLTHVSEDDFMRYTEFRYLVLAATLESKGRIGEIVERVVSDPDVKQELEAGKHVFFTQRNQWAKDQLMVVLVAKDLPTLREKIEANGDFLYAVFDTDFDRRLEEEMFERGEQKEVEENLMSLYGWTVRIQPDYFIAQEMPREGFVWLRRMYPERWLFVRWVEGGDTTLLNSRWVIGERNRIGATYYGGDRVVSQYLFSHRATFLGRPAQITSGLWENDSKVAGGPFKNFTFYDPLSDRVYMVDVAVFAPGREKVPLLRRMEIMAHTFRTVFDVEETE